MKKSWSILLVSMLLLSLLTACGGSKEKPDASGAGEPAAGKNEKIKVFISGGATFPDGEDINNNPWTELIEKENNVDLDIEYGPADTGEYMNKLTLKFASDDIPDLFIIPGSYQNWLMENADLGALMSLDDKLDAYPDLKNAVYPEAWEAARYDGKVYAVPVLNDGNLGTDNVYVRKDWLDKLHLEVPKTLEDFEKVAKAFRDQDPDGNGKKDTYGYIGYDNMLGWSNLFGAFGVIPGYWMEKDGKLVADDIQPEMKEALTYIHKLYEEKLLDNEWPIQKVKTYNEKVANNQVGIYEGSWAATRSEINTSKQNDPNANWIAIAPPVGPNGKQGVLGGGKYKTFAVISSKAKNVDAILKMLQWMSKQENIDKFVFGFGDKGEGFMYNMENGKYAMNFENHNKYGYRQQLMFMQPKELNTKKMEALGADFNLVGMIENSVKYGIENKFVGAPTPAMVENMSTLEKLRTETFTKIIVGQLPISAFDGFVKEYNDKGGAKIAEEVQKWYEETKQK
ncbi:extracellular solute-binding protein [Paenibacillus cellulositrophicus]|uniref:extracellular solute-binding protein n=1 Tax=Paenibacillus cellulositrophicus TaxID=562959 RepID=UPI003F7CE912